MALSINDPVSFANTEDYITEHINFSWKIDFPNKSLEGLVTITIRNITNKFADLKLDTKYLDIKEVAVDGKEVDFNLVDATVPALGTCLIIPVAINKDKFHVVIKYRTTNKCTALQWLDSAATKGKRYPYLFSQCQAIHARSLYPCQDTPGVKFSYTAEVQAEKNLQVLMSAVKGNESSIDSTYKIHKFEQKLKISSYLLAIVCGNLEGRKVGPRSTVWSEPEMVDAAAEEFSDTEKFLSIAEEICGPYLWGIYDILVLPPSFPYGGMENPCLTFVTPTLLVGDKSLVFVIAHEISHSWTGNLVTNKTWEDFWLNEGHTRYVERLIMEKHYNSELMRHLLIETGIACLQESLNSYGKDHPFNQMIPRLESCDPDDAFSRVPYEKGSNLLFHLESKCGKDKMQRWLKAYLHKFQNSALSSSEWKDFLYKYLIIHENVDEAVLDAVNWNEWFYGRWQIPVSHDLNRELSSKSESLADKWIAADINCEQTIAELDSSYRVMFPDQQYYFLQVLNDFRQACLPHDKITLMGQLYGYTTSQNSEILFGWAMLCIRSRYESAVDQIFEFLNSQGRLKYTKPIYDALYSWPEVRQRTLDNFNMVKNELHPITANGVRQLLKLDS